MIASMHFLVLLLVMCGIARLFVCYLAPSKPQHARYVHDGAENLVNFSCSDSCRFFAHSLPAVLLSILIMDITDNVYYADAIPELGLLLMPIDALWTTL